MPATDSHNLDVFEFEAKGLDHSAALAVGLGVHIAWTCTTLYSTQTVFEAAYAFLGIHGGSLSLLYLVSAIAFGVVALTLAAIDQKAIRYSRSRPAMAIAAAVTCVGTLIAVLSPAVPGLSFALESLSGIVTGIGSAVLMLYWGTALSRERVTTVAACASIGVALGFALNTMVLQSIPAPASGLCTAALPLVEFLILRDITPLPFEQGGPRMPFNPFPANKLRFSMRFVAPMALIGFALGILKHLSVQMTLGSTTAEGIVILLMAGCMTILLFVLYCLVPRFQENDTFLRIVVPTLACAALAISLAMEGNSTLNSLFALVAYIIAESLTWAILASIARKTHLSPVFLFGVSRGVITLAMLAGTIVPALAISQESITPALPAIVSIVFVALGYALMPRSVDILSLVSPCPLVRIVSLELDEGVSVLPALQTPAANEEKSTSAPIEEDSADQDEDEEIATEGPAASLEDDPDRAARLAMETHPQMGASEQDGEKRVGKFSRKIKLIARTYLLTERETDILFELAKGNSAISIQEKYYISAGTVKTHIRNIYRKLDVHKRQELLKLIEEFDAYDS